MFSLLDENSRRCRAEILSTHRFSDRRIFSAAAASFVLLPFASISTENAKSKRLEKEFFVELLAEGFALDKRLSFVFVEPFLRRRPRWFLSSRLRPVPHRPDRNPNRRDPLRNLPNGNRCLRLPKRTKIEVE